MPDMTIKLLKPHRHAGRDYPPGASVTLRQDKADWLISLGVAEASAAPAETEKQITPRAARKE